MMPPAEKVDEFQIDHLDFLSLGESYGFLGILKQLPPPL